MWQSHLTAWNWYKKKIPSTTLHCPLISQHLSLTWSICGHRNIQRTLTFDLLTISAFGRTEYHVTWILWTVHFAYEHKTIAIIFLIKVDTCISLSYLSYVILTCKRNLILPKLGIALFMSIKDRSTLDNKPPLKGFRLMQLPQGTCLDLAAAFTELHNCLLYRHGGMNSSCYETYDHSHLNIIYTFSQDHSQHGMYNS